MKTILRNAWAAWAGAGISVFFGYSLGDLEWWIFFIPLVIFVKVSEYSFYNEGVEDQEL